MYTKIKKLDHIYFIFFINPFSYLMNADTSQGPSTSGRAKQCGHVLTQLESETLDESRWVFSPSIWKTRPTFHTGENNHTKSSNGTISHRYIPNVGVDVRRVACRRVLITSSLVLPPTRSNPTINIPKWDIHHLKCRKNKHLFYFFNWHTWHFGKEYFMWTKCVFTFGVFFPPLSIQQVVLYWIESSIEINRGYKRTYNN